MVTGKEENGNACGELKRKIKGPRRVIHACSLGTLEAEVGGFQI
jgi:hypothetical protein